MHGIGDNELMKAFFLFSPCTPGVDVNRCDSLCEQRIRSSFPSVTPYRDSVATEGDVILNDWVMANCKGLATGLRMHHIIDRAIAQKYIPLLEISIAYQILMNMEAAASS